MSIRKKSISFRRSRGFSLIELMVSLTIGLVITVAALSAYMGAAGSSKIADAQARMNEDAQAALTILTQQLRMAGNNPDQANRALTSRRNPVYTPTPTYAGFSLAPNTFTLSSFSIRGCDGKFTNITSASNLDALTCAAGTSTLPDSIALNYEADAYNTEATSAGIPTDCLGNGLGAVTATLPTIVGGTLSNANVTYTVADNRFYIGTSTTIRSPSLYCKGSNTPQPLVENIEDLQFKYGTVSATTTATTATVAGYLDASDVVSETSLAALADDAARWVKVRTIRICVLVRSELPVANEATAAQYVNCSDTLVTMPPDKYLRRAYSTTVVLRNRMQ